MPIITNITDINESYDEIKANNLSVTSIEDRLISSFAQSATNYESERKAILGNVSNNSNLSSDEILKIQMRIQDYTVNLNKINTIARKSVSVVETLLRS